MTTHFSFSIKPPSGIASIAFYLNLIRTNYKRNCGKLAVSHDIINSYEDFFKVFENICMYEEIVSVMNLKAKLMYC